MKYNPAIRWYRHIEVAPARERGLKLMTDCHGILLAVRRSREGAWIEILIEVVVDASNYCRSREGAWIEISVLPLSKLLIWSLPRGSVD